MTTEQASHTALPWKVESESSANYVIGADGMTVALIIMPRTPFRANAAYIVKACNAYPEMLEALRGLSGAASLALKFGDDSDLRTARDNARAVLAEIEKGTTP